MSKKLQWPNLNPWYALLWRRLVRMPRRFFFLFDTPIRRRLYTEMAQVAHPDVLTKEAYKRLDKLHRILGTNSIYRYTPEQAEWINKSTMKLIDEIIAEEKQEKV